MHHLKAEAMLEFLEKRAQRADVDAGKGELDEVSEHLSSCARCRDQMAELGDLVRFLEDDRENEPSRGTLDEGIHLFQPVVRPGEGRGLAFQVARCVFDSFQRPTEGVRAVGVVPRQLLYRAGAVDIDLRIESGEGRVSVVGQMLSEADSFPERTEVRLEYGGVVHDTTSTNAVGEFSFYRVPDDEPFHIALTLPEGELRLFSVNRPAAS